MIFGFNKNKHYPKTITMFFVLLQFILLTFIFSSTPWLNLNPGSVVIITGSLLLGVYSIFSMGLNNLSIFPNVKANARFIARGPYKRIRHPMYTALILFAIGAVSSNPLPQVIYAFIALVFVLILKLRKEEKYLEKAFPEYTNYKKKTHRILPFIY